MAYSNKVTSVAVVVAAVLFLAVAVAQPMSEVDPMCAVSIPEIVKQCYARPNVSTTTPSKECCNDLRKANNMEVTCLCDSFVAHPNPLYSNITILDFYNTNIACNALDKYRCNGANGRVTNKIAASVGLFGLVASLLFF